MPDRPLRDADIERSVIASALLLPDRARLMVETLDSADFTDRSRRAVFRALVDAVANGLSDRPWEVADHIDDEVLTACQITRSQIRSWAGQGSDLGPAYFKGALQTLRKLRRQREIAHSLAAMQRIDLYHGDENDREAFTGLLQQVTHAYDSLSLNGHGGALKEIPLGDAMTEEPEPVPWVVTGWLAKGDLVILAGESGVGKSWALLDLAFALATGSSWLRYPIPEQQRVLYLDEENNSRLVRYRMRKWAFGNHRATEPEMRYLTENGLVMDDDVSYQRICALVEDYRPDWVMLDSLVRFHGRDENSNSQMSQFFTQRLRPLAARTGAGVICLHHLAKPSKERGDDIGVRLRGASDLKGIVDELWGLTEERESGQMILSHEKCRWGKPAAPVKLELDDVRGGRGVQLRYVGRADDVLGAIARVLAEAGEAGALRASIVDAVQADGAQHAARATSRALAELYEKNEVAKRREGRATRYWLTGEAPPDAE